MWFWLRIECAVLRYLFTILIISSSISIVNKEQEILKLWVNLVKQASTQLDMSSDNAKGQTYSTSQPG